MAINMECNRIEVNKHCVKDFIYVSSIGNSGVYEGCNGITHTRNFFFGGVCKWNSVGVHYFQTSSQELTSPNMKDREFYHKNAGRILPWDSVFKPCNFQRQFEDLSLLLVVISLCISLYLGELNQYHGNFHWGCKTCGIWNSKKQPLAATCSHSSGRKWPQVAARQVAASGPSLYW